MEKMREKREEGGLWAWANNLTIINQVADKAKTLASFADDYRKLAIDCLKVLHVEMKLETIFHMQEMTNREYLEDQDAEEPDDFVIALTAQITRRDEEMAPFVASAKQNYIFGGICSIAANASIKVCQSSEVNVLGREIPADAQDRVSYILSH
ncbi:exocyst complex component SEC8-like isoform X4 [Populus alba x Populus x berolinensis]|nr:exocyst complex component SEC8-like isoform X4 [Populus alba x Populus x berolinensis]